MNELQSVTDIDEVIKYAERRAEGCHEMASSYHTDEGVYLQEETRLQYRAIMWENIHEWLEELKELRKKERPHGKCNQCRYYEGVHGVQGHAPCSFWKIGGVLWNDFCSRYEKEGETEAYGL